MSLNEELNKLLNDLRSSIPELKGTLVASTDGMVVAHNVGSGDVNRMAAMVATALGLGKKICESFAGGDFSETSVSGASGQVFVYSAGSKGVLAAIVGHGANVGLIHLECRDKAKAIASLLN